MFAGKDYRFDANQDIKQLADMPLLHCPYNWYTAMHVVLGKQIILQNTIVLLV